MDKHDYSEKYIELAKARNLTLQVGTKNGQKNGLELLVDVESFEYSYYPRGGRGFIIGLSDLGERNIIRQEGCFRFLFLSKNILSPGFYVEPGTESLASLSIFGSQASPAALSFFKNEKFCYTEDDFQPLHYNLVIIV